MIIILVTEQMLLRKDHNIIKMHEPLFKGNADTHYCLIILESIFKRFVTVQIKLSRPKEQKRVVYVGQIPIKLGKRYLYNRFKEFGTIQSLTLHKKPEYIKITIKYKQFIFTYFFYIL